MAQEIRNLAIDDDYEKTLEDFGGETLLKEKYPRILEMLQNTREMKLAGLLSGDDSDEDDTGYQDTYWLDETPETDADGKVGLFVESRMSMLNNYSSMLMNSRTWDVKSNRTLATYSVYEDIKDDEDKRIVEKQVRLDHSKVSYSNRIKVRTQTTYSCAMNKNGKCYLANGPVVRTQEIDLDTMESVVKKIDVIQPRERDGAEIIRVVYNGRWDQDAAYNFTKATDGYKKNMRYVTVYYPFLLEIELAGDGKTFTFDADRPVNFDEFRMSLYSDVVRGGEVCFNTSRIKQIKCERVASNKLRMDFHYSGDTKDNYWGLDMVLTELQAAGTFDFRMDFPINYRDKYGTAYSLYLVVTSENDMPESNEVAVIKKSRILWGCIGADAMIRTEAGAKKMSELAAGDMIYTENGNKRLINLVTGQEDEMVSITVEGHEELLLSDHHAIPVERGIVEARNLLPDDRVRLEDGSYVPILTLKRVPYGGMVYSPELSESEMVFVNGIMVGDYLVTADPQNEERPCDAEPLPQELREELIRWSEERNSQYV